MRSCPNAAKSGPEIIVEPSVSCSQEQPEPERETRAVVVGKPEMIPTLQLQPLSQVVRLAVLELRLLPLWSNINVNSWLQRCTLSACNIVRYVSIPLICDLPCVGVDTKRHPSLNISGTFTKCNHDPPWTLDECCMIPSMDQAYDAAGPACEQWPLSLEQIQKIPNQS